MELNEMNNPLSAGNKAVVYFLKHLPARYKVANHPVISDKSYL